MPENLSIKKLSMYGGVGILVVGAIALITYFVGVYDPKVIGLQLMPGNGNSVIRYKEGDLASAQAYVDEIDTFFKSYNVTESEKYINCLDNNRTDDQVCRFDTNWFRSCSKKNNYGYSTSRPCVFFSLNLDHKPDVYTNLSEIPSEITQDLEIEIKETLSEDGKPMRGVWLECNKHVYLMEPDWYFPDYYFDKVDMEGYLAPVIAVQFNLQKAKNQDVNIECRLWAKSISTALDNYSKVSFTLRVDEK